MHILCRDMPKTIDIWVKGLFAAVEEYREFSGAKGAILDIGTNAKLYIKEVPCEWDPETPRRSGLEHIGMVVEDLDAAMETLQALPDVSFAGKPFVSMPMRCVYAVGPEGSMLGVMEYARQ